MARIVSTGTRKKTTPTAPAPSPTRPLSAAAATPSRVVEDVEAGDGYIRVEQVQGKKRISLDPDFVTRALSGESAEFATGAASRALTIAQMKAIPVASRFDGMRVRMGSVIYAFDEDNESDAEDQLVIAPSEGSGRYIADVGQIVDIRMPFTFATANNAVLYTVPSNWGIIMMLRGYWECSEAFAGGAGSALGIDSDEFGLTTAGDLHGGATGDTATWLGVGGGGDTFYPTGTPGTKFGAGPVMISAWSSFQLNRITSAFTSGEGAFHAVCMVTRPLTS